MKRLSTTRKVIRISALAGGALLALLSQSAARAQEAPPIRCFTEAQSREILPLWADLEIRDKYLRAKQQAAFMREEKCQLMTVIGLLLRQDQADGYRVVQPALHRTIEYTRTEAILYDFADGNMPPALPQIAGNK